MRENVLRFVTAGLVALLAGTAGAHEFECEKKAGLLKVGENGLLLQDGLPVFLAAPAPVLRIQQYPATIGFEITLRNKAMAPSVVRVVGDPLLDALGGAATWFGTAIVPDLSVPVGGAVTTIAAVAVRSQAECLALLEGGTFEAPVCRDVVENRFFVEHDVGSAECRARIVCAPPAAPAPCATPWGGPKKLDVASRTRDLAVDDRCNVNVTGSMPEPVPGQFVPFFDALLARLDAAGAVDQTLRFGRFLPTQGVAEDEGQGVAVDGAGNRFVWWDSGIPKVTNALAVSRFAPDGTEDWTTLLETTALVAAKGIALDAAGNPYVAGHHWLHGPYAAKLDAATGAVLWKRELMPDDTNTSGAAVDPAGNLLVAGHYFVAKLAPDGSPLWLTRFSSPGEGIFAGVGTDAFGNVYVAVSRHATPRFPAPDLVKLDPDGNVLLLHAFVGLVDASEAADVAIASDGVWVVGDVTPGFPVPTPAGVEVFVSKLDFAGNLLWVKTFGGAGDQRAEAVTVDALGNGYVSYDGGDGRYVVKLDRDGNVQ